MLNFLFRFRKKFKLFSIILSGDRFRIDASSRSPFGAIPYSGNEHGPPANEDLPDRDDRWRSQSVNRSLNQSVDRTVDFSAGLRGKVRLRLD
jgi:hypothetical protein